MEERSSEPWVSVFRHGSRTRFYPLQKADSLVSKCRIQSVGKRRDGGTRYWCLEHRADATAKYGTRASSCRYAGVIPPEPSQILEIDLRHYSGGVALWGAVPPVYDTTSKPLDRGVHVHARAQPGGEKVIDATYREVHVAGLNSRRSVQVVSELSAIYYMVSRLFGFRTHLVVCPRCSHQHLDKDWFAVHPHQKHLCEGCGRTFTDTRRGIGNPLSPLANETALQPRPAAQSASIRQKDFPGGISIWGSNPAFIWTGAKAEEEGIHVHAFQDPDSDEPDLDETFSRLEVDGIELDPMMVRYAMAQSALPHVDGRLSSLECPKCGKHHFDDVPLAFDPHHPHVCERCSKEFDASGRLKKTISNPFVNIAATLAEVAIREPRTHTLDLIPEAP